jgi:hypothetical protein
MKIIYLSQFAKMMRHNVVQQPIVDVAMGEQPRAFWDPTSNSEFSLPPMEASFRRETHELKTFYEITRDQMMSKRYESDAMTHMMRAQMQEQAFKQIEEEFKIMVAKRNPTFFMKDLSMENVEKLSEEYAKQMGNDACGVQIQLSPYQKFFVIADPNDFVFYVCQVEKYRIDQPAPVIEVMGKLVDLRPDKWKMGRYEDSTYIRELFAIQNV